MSKSTVLGRVIGPRRHSISRRRMAYDSLPVASGLGIVTGEFQEGNVMLRICVLILFTAIASPVPARPLPGSDVAVGDTVQVLDAGDLADPVIEEPIRPLYPDGPISRPLVSGSQCGAIGFGGLAMMLSLTWLIRPTMSRRRSS